MNKDDGNDNAGKPDLEPFYFSKVDDGGQNEVVGKNVIRVSQKL